MGHSAAVWDSQAAVETVKDLNGIEQVVLRNPQGASVTVSMLGARVTSWRNSHGEELLFTSSKGTVKAPKAMRGGIPICFPQFDNCASPEQQGFARNKMWRIDENPPPLKQRNDCLGKSFVDLLLKPSGDDLKCWPHSFEFRLRVCLAANGAITLISRVRNVNGKPFSFIFAYHAYLSVSDISEVRIEGLETSDYLDNLCKKERFTEQDAITFESEVDRVYLSSPNVIAVLDHEKKRTFVIRKEGLPDVVVWNPWDKKCKGMADVGDGEYKQMLCVDGAAMEKPITLKPGEEWTGQMEISVVESTLCAEHLDLEVPRCW
uniref:glucose-6-phosphate 1-epimerase n=1 Tax=Kalanchoe fedtschenkoi TaxID=63787 RepID=A0A7N0T4Y5_KALFE